MYALCAANIAHSTTSWLSVSICSYLWHVSSITGCRHHAKGLHGGKGTRECMERRIKHHGSHRFAFIPIHISTGKGRVVCGPNHGPRADVEQRTARARSALTVAYAQWIVRVLAAVHASGAGAVLPGCNQRQLAQDVREGNIIHRDHRLWGCQVQELGSNLRCAGPPMFSLSRAIIVQGLDKSTLALLDATSVGADPHLENQIDASIPALVDGREMIRDSAAEAE
jgi:hypothetical protein